MKITRILLTFVFLMASTQVQAFTLDLSKNGFGGLVYSDVGVMSFDGKVDIRQQLSNYMPYIGSTFSLSNINMTSLQYYDLSGAPKAYDAHDLFKLSITGTATGHVTAVYNDAVDPFNPLKNLFKYEYDSINLSLAYNGTTLAQTVDFDTTKSGGNLSDGIWAEATGSYDIVAELGNILSQVFRFNGVDGSTFTSPYAITAGSIRLSEVPNKPVNLIVTADSLTAYKAGIGGGVQLATPEPASLLLLGSGLLGLYGIRRRKSN